MVHDLAGPPVRRSATGLVSIGWTSIPLAGSSPSRYFASARSRSVDGSGSIATLARRISRPLDRLTSEPTIAGRPLHLLDPDHRNRGRAEAFAIFAAYGPSCASRSASFANANPVQPFVWIA